MTTWLSLDLSLSSTGWALFSSGSQSPIYGHWPLASDMSWRGRGYVRLHKNMMDLHRVSAIDHIYYEEPLTQASLSGKTNVQTLQTLTGLAAHAESFAAAIKATARAVNIASWRRHFIGSMPRGTKTPDLKAMTMRRCKELGFDPSKYDESDALGLLDYQLSVAGVIAPWRANVLERKMTPELDGKRARA